ncbi:MAG TPA: 50S ribosomal protein L15 [Candidatus Paceibacterota bacterium]
MQLHNIQQLHSRKRARQVGRGGKRGKTSGRGTKGQKARAGRKMRPEIRDIVRRLPRQRGRGKNSNMSIQQKPVVVNLVQIEKYFSAGGIVSPETLVEKGLIVRRGGTFPGVKILSNGELTKKLTIKECEVSAQAKVKIEKTGGTIVVD